MNSTTDGPTSDPGRTQRKNRGDISPEEHQRILELHSHGYGMRQIALRVQRDRKTVRRILQEEGQLDRHPPDPAGKLDPFRELIQEKVRKRLTVTRILREIRQQGYSGGRTILGDYIRSIRSELVPRRIKRRFETRPGQEMQVDWTVYTVPIAGSPARVHALICELAYSRKAHVHFYRNEREPTLLEGLALAFESFEGVTQRVVFDSMSTVVLGRIGPNRKPVWHPRFLEFANFYGFEPFLCKVRDPDRKGKAEKFIRFLEDDCVRGAEFASFDNLNEQVHNWLDNVANRRIHGTTGLIPDEAWLSERDFLIRLPDTGFAFHEDGIRQVGPDATIWIQGTPYTVPARLANRSAAVRLYAEHFEVMDHSGQIAFSRRYVERSDKGRLQIDPAHYATIPQRNPGPAGTRIDELFLKRFPQLAGLVEGITKRMKSLAPIHLRALWRLADLYGEPPFLTAAARVIEYRRFNAEAVRRILERDYPLPEPPPVTPMSPAARTLALLSEVDPASLDSFAHLDQAEPSTPQEQSPDPTPAGQKTELPAAETKDQDMEGEHGS